MRRHRKTTVLPSGNREWGFYGTVATERGEVAAKREWQKMYRRCVKAGLSSVSCRDFLDSRIGRHLADRVLDSYQRAISAAELKRDYVKRWRHG